MDFLKDKIKQLNERIINNEMILREIEKDALNRQVAWSEGEDSGIEGSDMNGNFKY